MNEIGQRSITWVKCPRISRRNKSWSIKCWLYCVFRLRWVFLHSWTFLSAPLSIGGGDFRWQQWPYWPSIRQAVNYVAAKRVPDIFHTPGRCRQLWIKVISRWKRFFRSLIMLSIVTGNFKNRWHRRRLPPPPVPKDSYRTSSSSVYFSPSSF